MSKGPGLYSAIGKKTRDLLYRDYQSDQKFSFTTNSPTGAVIASSATKKGELLFADVSTQLKHGNITADVKVDTDSNLLGTVTVNEAGPGLKTILSTKIPDQRSTKLEVQYLLDYGGINASVGLTANPTVNFSGTIGSNVVSFGIDASFDTETGEFTKYNAGFSVSNADLITSLFLNEKDNLVSASYYHLLSPLTNSAVGAEVTRNFLTFENTITVGGQRALDPLTTVKARFNNSGKVHALIQREWRPRSLFTISGEVDTQALDKTPKLGLALALKP